ncbi:MAG: hypothetical protein Q8O03_04265 [Nanoarchaeota archaeon]|nr:hypothetical protein [Nanoarchaeota archaeon]
MKKDGLKISLEEYLKEDEEVTRFISPKNNDFWNDQLKISAQIPVEWLVERDPTSVIVGKEKEIHVGKLVNYLGAQIELEREMRFADLFTLLLEIDYLKKNGFRAEIEKTEINMENSPDYDWERDYHKLINGLVEEKKYNRNKIIKHLFKNLEKVVMDAEINYKKISDKLRLELPTPPTFYLEGPMGSGKSFVQRRLMLSYMKLTKEVGIRGFDVLSIRDPLDSDRPKVIKLLGGEGIKLTTYYDNILRRKKVVDKWKNKAITGTIVAFPVYYAFRIGLELAKYSWGLGIGVDPLADIGMWVNENFKWIAYITTVALGNKVINAYIKKISKVESKRPEWLSNAKSIPPVYVGSVGRANLEGEYKENAELPPQSWLRGSGMMASDGKIAIIEQLPELTADEQSWLSQLIQEREISIGNKGEHTIDIFPIIYMGANPHLTKNIEQPLMDRLQLGASCYVTNEIERNEKTERKLYLFLEYYRKAKGGKPFTKESLDSLLEISSKLAENKNQIEISRRYLSLVDAAIDSSNKSKEPCVTKEDVIKSLKNTKSIIEQSIEVRINEHYKTSQMSMEISKIGIAKILGYMTDRYMIEHKNTDLKKQIEEENGLSYITEVAAEAKGVSSGKQPELRMLIPEKWKDKKQYLEERLSVMLNNHLDMSKYDITVDLSKVLEEDDALLPATYIAVLSAIEKKPLRQDMLIAASCNVKGELLPVSKVNKRMYTAPDNVSSVTVSPYDFDEKLSKNLHIGPHVSKAEDVKRLYEVLTK